MNGKNSPKIARAFGRVHNMKKKKKKKDQTSRLVKSSLELLGLSCDYSFIMTEKITNARELISTAVQIKN